MIASDFQEKVKGVLERYRGFTPIEVAKDLGVEIVYPELTDNDFAGAIKKAPTGQIVIYVNKNDPDIRQLFTVAHELGHFFLHNEKIDEGIVSYRHAAFYRKYTDEQRKIEEEANNFAAEMLMPEKAFRRYFEEHSELPTEDLVAKMADFFGVSAKAIKVRMSYLDLISIG